MGAFKFTESHCLEHGEDGTAVAEIYQKAASVLSGN